MEQGRKDEGRRTGGDKDDDAGREGRPGDYSVYRVVQMKGKTIMNSPQLVGGC